MTTPEEPGPPAALPFTLPLPGPPPGFLPGGTAGDHADGFACLARIWADPGTDWTGFFLPDDHPG